MTVDEIFKDPSGLRIIQDTLTPAEIFKCYDRAEIWRVHRYIEGSGGGLSERAAFRR